MQWSRQKRRQVGSGDAAAERELGTAQAPERDAEMSRERGQVIRAAIGQSGFGPMPHALIRVQLGGVCGEELHVQPRERVTEVADRLASVDPAVVPEDDHRPAQMAQQVAQEGADLRVVDVGGVELVVETQAPAQWADGHGGDHGELVVSLPTAQQRGLPPRRPGLAHTGDQEEARFVEEDEVGTQPRSVFFTRGQARRFQWAIRASLRSSARASGF